MQFSCFQKLKNISGQQAYVGLAICCEAVAIVLSLAALFNPQWVTGKGYSTNPYQVGFTLTIDLGLWQGSKTFFYITGRATQTLNMVCDCRKSKCMMSCGTDYNKMQEDLQSFLNGNSSAVDESEICPSIGIKIWNSTEEEAEQVSIVDSKRAKKHLLNCGLVAATISFLSFAIISGGIGFTAGVLSCIEKCEKKCFCSKKLNFFHIVTCASQIIVLALWGAQFSFMDSIPPIRNALTGEYKFKSISLGTSYRMVIASTVFYLPSTIYFIGKNCRRKRIPQHQDVNDGNGLETMR